MNKIKKEKRFNIVDHAMQKCTCNTEVRLCFESKLYTVNYNFAVFFHNFLGKDHWITIYIETKAKCRHLKNLLVKGICGRCLPEFIDWIFCQSCWCFRPSFVSSCPANLFFGSTLPSFPCQSIVYTDSVWLGGGVGCRVVLETIVCRSLTLCIWPDSEPTKLHDHPKQKPGSGGDLRKIKPTTKSLFLEDDI
jgi:hypothetical protein